ncbi:MAG: hypothetical protein ACTII7_03565 [Galactobacter sp.]
MLARLTLLSLACTVAGGYLYKVDHDLAWVPILTAVVLLITATLAVIKTVRSRHEFTASELAREEERVLESIRN